MSALPPKSTALAGATKRANKPSCGRSGCGWQAGAWLAGPVTVTGAVHKAVGFVGKAGLRWRRVALHHLSDFLRLGRGGPHNDLSEARCPHFHAVGALRFAHLGTALFLVHLGIIPQQLPVYITGVRACTLPAFPQALDARGSLTLHQHSLELARMVTLGTCCTGSPGSIFRVDDFRHILRHRLQSRPRCRGPFGPAC